MVIGHEYTLRRYLLAVLVDLSQKVHFVVAVLDYQLAKADCNCTRLADDYALHLQAGVLLGEDLVVKLT